MKDVLRVGVLSCAHVHTPSYIQVLQSLPDVALVGLWDNEEERGGSCAREYDSTYYRSLNELLESVDAVVVTAENVRHRELVLRAAEAGVDVLCEKPLATTVEDAREMVEACRARGVRLGTAFPVRYSTSVQQLRSSVEQGLLGGTLMIRATNRGTYPGGWFGDPELSGGGAVMDHTVHVADLLRWIWGAEFTAVYAERATRYHDLPVEDSGLLLITLDNGVTASLDCSWSRPNEAYPTWGDVTMEVTGELGVANLDVFRQNLDVYSNRAVRAEWRNWGDDLDLLMLRDWVAAMREGREAPITGEDGLRAVELVAAAYRSAEWHKPALLEEIGD